MMKSKVCGQNKVCWGGGTFVGGSILSTECSCYCCGHYVMPEYV